MLVGLYNPTIIIGKEGCFACQQAQEHFVAQKIPYIYVNYDSLTKEVLKQLYNVRKENNVQEMMLPLIIRGGVLQSGFSETNLEETTNNQTIRV